MQGTQFQGVSYYHGQVKFYQTKLQVYIYAVDGMLVDSGPSRLQKEIAEFCQGQSLQRIVHTHFHEDHTGNTAYLMQKYQIPAYTNSTVQEICAVKGQIPIYRRIFWGPRPGFAAQPL
ncbi:MAG TPA: MBL fold metallo-hydrolase, partial [Verrucomicrobiae bacterium]|nr:MBL fold metallo-hydrolase [Verrucomicrobiae bacterium]